jgi:hypothetical protein
MGIKEGWGGKHRKGWKTMRNDLEEGKEDCPGQVFKVDARCLLRRGYTKRQGTPVWAYTYCQLRGSLEDWWAVWKAVRFLKQLKQEVKSIILTAKYWFASFIDFELLYCCCTGVHCDIYKSSYNISQLNSPPPSFSFIPHPPFDFEFYHDVVSKNVWFLSISIKAGLTILVVSQIALKHTV